MIETHRYFCPVPLSGIASHSALYQHNMALLVWVSVSRYNTGTVLLEIYARVTEFAELDYNHMSVNVRIARIEE